MKKGRCLDRNLSCFPRVCSQKKGVLLMFLLGIMLVGGFVSGESESSARVDLTIAGCGDILAGSCSDDGKFYCGEDLILHSTLNEDRACSFGKESYDYLEDPECCPPGYFCGDDGDGHITCNQIIKVCGNMSKPKCEAAEGCFWIEGNCVNNPSEYSCSIYTTNDSCISDDWRLGQIGAGTNVCGTYIADEKYVISQDSCRCDWTDNSCVLGYDVSESYSGDVPNLFRCSKGFDIGECINGIQDIKWTAKPEVISGYTLGIPSKEIPNEVLEASGCENSEGEGTERKCGESIVKLPGFSLFALLSSIGFVGLFYLFRRE